MKKILAVGISLLLLGCVFMPNASAETVTGRFTATASLDVDVNNTSPAFGSIAVSSNKTVELHVENVGTVTASVTQDDADGNNENMTLAAISGLSNNEYGVAVSVDGGSQLVDIATADDTVISASLAKDATQNYNLTVFIGPSLSAESYVNETFTANTIVAAIS